jgi:hypothetical protein
MLDIEGRLMGSSCFSIYSYMITTRDYIILNPIDVLSAQFHNST